MAKVSGQRSGRSKWFLRHLDFCPRPFLKSTTESPSLLEVFPCFWKSNFHKAFISHQKNIFSRVGPLLEIFLF